MTPQGKFCYQKLLTELRCSAEHSPGKTVLDLRAMAAKLKDISGDASVQLVYKR